MPEVVEVKLTALWLNKELAGKQIKKIVIHGGRYSRHPLTNIDMINDNKPVINKIDSKGKLMWFELNNGVYIMSRFGLQGEWGFEKHKHSGVEFVFDSHDSLYYTDPIAYGTLTISYNYFEFDDEVGKLGIDVLADYYDSKFVKNKIEKYLMPKNRLNKSRYNKEVIKILMDQQVLFCGIGNYLSAEILYEAKISPYTKIGKIYDDDELLHTLITAIKYVVKKSYINADIGYLEHMEKGIEKFIKTLRANIYRNKNYKYNYQKDTIIEKNDVFQYKVYQKDTDPLGNPVEKSKIIKGRTTHWSPKVQL